MSEEKYPDTIELKLTLRFSESSFNSTKMKYLIEISQENLERLQAGKYVEGSIRKDEQTGNLVFRAYNRKSVKRRKDVTICHLEHGWLKESSNRIKFFNSVDKKVGALQISKAMTRELEFAMDEMFLQNIL